MEKFYRSILTNAWKINLRNKWLWLLGLFAAIIGNGSVYEALLRGFNNISEGRSVFYTFREYVESGVFGMFSWAKISALWQTDPSAFGMSMFYMIVMICLIAILITIGVIGQGALIAGVIGIDQKKKVRLKNAFHVGVEKFWPILELNVITKIFLLGVLIFLAYLASLIVFASSVFNIFIYVLSFIVFVILGIIIYFLTIYGTAYIILRNLGPWSALKKAWKLFTKNVMLNLEMGFLLFILNIVVGILFFIANFIIISPIFVIYVLFLFAGAKIIPAVLMIIMILVFVVVMLVVGSWWSSFQLGTWALLFEKLDSSDAKSKIQRWFENVKTRRKKRK